MSDEYIKKADALKAVYGMTRYTGIDEAPYEYAEGVIDDLPTYSIPKTATSGEYIRKADMERILYSTCNAVRIGEEFLELPTYVIPKMAAPEEIEVCIEGGGYPFGKRIMSDKFFPDSSVEQLKWERDYTKEQYSASLKEIRAEIAELEDGIWSYTNDRPWIFKDQALAVIDKHLGGDK